MRKSTQQILLSVDIVTVIWGKGDDSGINVKEFGRKDCNFTIQVHVTLEDCPAARMFSSMWLIT